MRELKKQEVADSVTVSHWTGYVSRNQPNQPSVTIGQCRHDYDGDWTIPIAEWSEETQKTHGFSPLAS